MAARPASFQATLFRYPGPGGWTFARIPAPKRRGPRGSLLTLLVAVGLVVVAVAGEVRADEPPVVIGSRAPALPSTALEGDRPPPPLATGRPTVVDFFATWCEPCHLALAALGRIVAAEGGRIDLVLVDVGEPRETVAAFFAHHPLPAGARVLLDGDRAAAARWGQRRFPTTFLVDGAGVIRHINRGYGGGYEARLGGWLRSMTK